MSVCVCPVCILMHAGIRFPRAGLKDSCELPYVDAGIQGSPLQEPNAISKPSLQPWDLVLCTETIQVFVNIVSVH